MSGSAIRIDRHESGPRVYVAGIRVHHGSAGILAIAAAAIPAPRPIRRAILLAGLAALAHDRKDFPFRDTDNH
jgi:hypothetical protein